MPDVNIDVGGIITATGGVVVGLLAYFNNRRTQNETRAEERAASALDKKVDDFERATHLLDRYESALERERREKAELRETLDEVVHALRNEVLREAAKDGVRPEDLPDPPSFTKD